MRKDRNDYQGAQIARTDLAPAAFILFALIGGTLVSLSKFYPVHLGIVIAVPVLVVVLYTVVAWSLPRLELRRDQIGDNAYYLGFLLTLISLTTTLIQYNSQAKEDFIVSNFGVALSATIAGIANAKRYRWNRARNACLFTRIIYKAEESNVFECRRLW